MRSHLSHSLPSLRRVSLQDRKESEFLHFLQKHGINIFELEIPYCLQGTLDACPVLVVLKLTASTVRLLHTH